MRRLRQAKQRISPAGMVVVLARQLPDPAPIDSVSFIHSEAPMSTCVTDFGSLQHFVKGGVQVIDDNAKDYAFSNVFEVASRSAALGGAWRFER